MASSPSTTPSSGHCGSPEHRSCRRRRCSGRVGPCPVRAQVVTKWARGGARHQSELARPLSGVRVLSFGAFIAGNTTGLVLAELGADVVKIEARTTRGAAHRGLRVRRDRDEPSGVTNTMPTRTSLADAEPVARHGDRGRARALPTARGRRGRRDRELRWAEELGAGLSSDDLPRSTPSS